MLQAPGCAARRHEQEMSHGERAAHGARPTGELTTSVSAQRFTKPSQSQSNQGAHHGRLLGVGRQDGGRHKVQHAAWAAKAGKLAWVAV